MKYTNTIIVSFCLSLLLLLGSCTHELRYSKAKSLSEALTEAQNSNKYLMVITENTECSACDSFRQRIARSPELKSLLSKKFLLYRYKRNDSFSKEQSLFYVSANEGTPVTYVFSPSGMLANVITGAKPVSDIELELKYTLEGEPAYSLFIPKLKECGKREQIAMYNRILTIDQQLQNSEVPKDTLESALTYLSESERNCPYFYNTYLLAEVNRRLDKPEDAKQWSEKALQYNTVSDRHLYAPLRNKLRFQIGGQYDNAIAPKISFSSKEYDFKTLKKDEPGIATFFFENTGKSPLIITEVKGNCGCTAFDWTKDPIMPGGKGMVSATYDAKAAGVFRKMIFVLSNAENELVELTIKGRVE